MTLERGALLHNRYRIVEILGQGGMGSVYRAVDENLGVDVAVKENLFTTDEYARQFRLEAVILANLRHSNLTRVTDHFVIGDQGQYLVMDYIEGEDLRQRMERSESLPEDEVVLIGAAVCKALQYLHTRKPPILHRDVKPGNVKITPDGEIFLVDFGLAKVIQGSEVTTTGARAMTPGYSPPEQYGTARTDPRTDVYSLGATLYAALTGVIPEDGLARAMENAELTPIRKRNPKVSRRLAAIIEKAMEVDADDRFQTAEEFRKALLSANSKTQHLSEDDFTITPSPAEFFEPEAEDEKDAAEDIPSIGVPLKANTAPAASNSSTTSKRAKRKKRAKRIRRFLWLIIFLGGAAAVYFYFPTIKDTLSQYGIEVPAFPTITMPVVMETEVVAVLPPIEEATETQPTPTETVTATLTLTPTLTQTPEPTSTPTPTQTLTPAPTPIGGGAGEIAFVSDRTGTPQIYIAKVDGSDIRPITNLPEGACQPDWSPDGRQLVFVSPCEVYQDPMKGSSLFIIDADGKNIRQLSSIPGGDFEPDWSPDGKKIAFTSLRDGYMQIYTINLADNKIVRLTKTDKQEFARQPSWSPFGNQIAYSLRRYSAYQIWVMNDDGENPEQITRSGYALWDINPTWSPDGASLLYSQHRADTSYRVWLMTIRYENRGQEGIDVGAEPLPINDVTYSPDGFWLAFEGEDNAEDNRNVYIMTAAGSSRLPISTDPANEFDPAWRPLP